MTFQTRTDWRVRSLVAGCAVILAIVALATGLRPAQARVWVSIGVPFPGYYGPRPYYAYPGPYYYAPPAYYPPAYYPAPDPYLPAAPAPSAYTPPDYSPAAAAPAAAPAATPSITYTNKPAFTNSAGQTCREYKTTDTTSPHPVDVFGTACKQADGQWRVVN